MRKLMKLGGDRAKLAENTNVENAQEQIEQFTLSGGCLRR